MLTLTRKAGEMIVVDGPAAFLVEEIRGNRVRVRMIAPLTTRVLRGELHGAEDLLKLKPTETEDDAGV